MKKEFEETLETEQSLSEQPENSHVDDELPPEPKTITFEIGVNGEPTLNIKCDKQISLLELVRAMASIDLAIFHNEYRKNKENSIQQFSFINTWRKQMLLQDISEMYPEDGLDMIEKLVDML